MNIKNTLHLACFLLLGTSLFAGGYRVQLQGIRQASMGNTSAMHTKDASVAFYNPAGLAFIDSQISIAAGVFGISANAKYQNPLTGEQFETEDAIGTPFYFAASYKPTKDLALGLSVTTPFGNSVEWPENWTGNGLVSKINLRAIFVQPTVAYRFSEWFSMGAGFIYASGQINLQRRPTIGNNLAYFELDDTDAVGLGWNLGFHFKPSEKLNIGVAYRSHVDMEANNGEAIWRDVPTSVATPGSIFTTNSFGAELPLPAEFTAGVSYQATPKLLLSGEMALTEWSRYKTLDINLENTDTGQTFETSSDRNFEDRVVWRAGAEYMLTDALALRGGYYFDPSPSPAHKWSPETPSLTQHAFTGGLGYQFKNGFNVDIYGHYLNGREREVNNIDTNFAGQVKSTTWIAGVGLSYNFGENYSIKPEETVEE